MFFRGCNLCLLDLSTMPQKAGKHWVKCCLADCPCPSLLVDVEKTIRRCSSLISAHSTTEVRLRLWHGNTHSINYFVLLWKLAGVLITGRRSSPGTRDTFLTHPSWCDMCVPLGLRAERWYCAWWWHGAGKCQLGAHVSELGEWHDVALVWGFAGSCNDEWLPSGSHLTFDLWGWGHFV